MTEAEKEAQALCMERVSLHSSQRLQMLTFWLVSVEFLVAAYVQAEVCHLTVLAVAVAIAGMLSTLAFTLSTCGPGSSTNVGHCYTYRAYAALHSRPVPD